MDEMMIPHERIESRIFMIRGHKVILDVDLSILYDVPTKALIQAIKRNYDRFPVDFMFRLTAGEFDNLRSQSVTSSWGGRRYLPYAFTEQGIAMLSSVLRSQRAIRVNIQIMRTFYQLRQIISTHEDLKRRIESMEGKYDQQFKVVFDAIKAMIEPPIKKSKIGFLRERE